MIDFLRAFLRFDPPAIRRAVFLNFAVALTEGAGFLTLVPLLSLVGELGQGGDTKSWRASLDQFGISWNIEIALIVFITLIFLQSLLVLLKDSASNALYLRFVDHLRKTLYASIVSARWSFFSGRHSSELLSVLTSDMQQVGHGANFLLRLFSTSILVCIYLLVAFGLSISLTLLALAIAAGLWLVLRDADSVVKQSGSMLSGANRRLFGQIQEFFSAMKLIKIHGEEADNVRHFNNEVDQISHHAIQFRQVYVRMQAAYRVGGAIALAAVSYAALAWFKLPAAKLLVMIAIFARGLSQLAALQSGRQYLLHMLPAYAAWQRLITASEANRDPMQSIGNQVTLVRDIVFDRVVFSHTKSHHTLRVETLTIPAKKTTAIIGNSGAGKTTLLDLLSGLNSPDSGTILIDGVPLLQSPGWRQSIAYIPQETIIQNGTVRENLIWGNVVPSAAEIEQALSQAALTELVKRLPQELDTEVGERGVKLSGGERQRLALARALLRRPQILVLDEAASALDSDNHRIVLDAICALNGRMTVLIVTHRHEDLAGMIDGFVTIEHGVAGIWEAVNRYTFNAFSGSKNCI